MKVLVNFVKKLFNIVFLLLSPVRRLICRRRRHSDTPILPLTATFPTALPPANEPELQPWDTWGVEESQGRNRGKQDSPQPEPEIDFFQGMTPTIKKTAKPELQPWDTWGVEESQGRNRGKQDSPQPEPEIDFFQGMTPTIKKTAKILIKKKEMDTSENVSASNRLAMTSEFPAAVEAELGVWEEETSSWEEASEDLTWQADATIKEKKRAEREARQIEQQRRKIVKESLRGTKKENTFTAIRLS